MVAMLAGQPIELEVEMGSKIKIVPPPAVDLLVVRTDGTKGGQ